MTIMRTESLNATKSAIERDFPFEDISKIAERESWRKEVYRPTYYLHKWWARRLGSVFRAIIIGACSGENENILDQFYKPTRFKNVVIYDPMMGSGVTVGEAKKLGCKVIGRDINPVSYLLVKAFMNDYSLAEIQDTFDSIREDVSRKIKSYYKAKTHQGEIVDVLYYFWVKTIQCPSCKEEIQLFPTTIFSRHAYPNKDPSAKSLCPFCQTINSVKVSDIATTCSGCGQTYNLHEGPASRKPIMCPSCKSEFSIIESLSHQREPPHHRMYAKMILTNEGKKEYSSIDQYDLELYEKASRDFQNDALRIPNVEIHPGHNTDQILNYNYRHWSQLFNERQLLCLGILAQRIKKIEKKQLKELFATLFSGCLEFNNMFCSFKGEGTGAVRHMFSHHILKPEKMPLEANVWGTSKSSGSFSTLFEQRVIRSIQYKDDPFELCIEPETGHTRKARRINHALVGRIASSYAQFKEGVGFDTYLSCGSSDQTDIEDQGIDFVITDPPFFSNVQYSELADFFYVWQREIFEMKDIFESETTRSEKEIQEAKADRFGRKLAAVFSDCNRVLRDDGLMIFTFHQSDIKGWAALLYSLRTSGFYVERVYFVKSEMSVAVPKSRAKSPIDLDAIIVCRKLMGIPFTKGVPENLVSTSVDETKQSITRFAKVHFNRLSANDLKNMLISNMMTSLSLLENDEVAAEFIMSQATRLENLAAELRKEQDQPK